MSNLIRANNNQQVNAIKTYLSSDLTAGVSQVIAKNHNGFFDGWAVQVGEVGEERSEITTVNGTPTTGTISIGSALRYSHPADTPLYCYKYNQVVFLRSITGTAGTATAMTNGTVTITPDQPDTLFDDTSGSSSYTYKTRFRSSGLAVESADSDWIYPAGANPTEQFSLYRLRERSKNKLLNKVEDSVIDEWLNEWHESMTNGLIEINRDYAIGTTNVAFTAGSQYGTLSVDDFKLPRHVVLLDSAGTHEVDPKELTDNKPAANHFLTGRDTYFFRGDNVIGRDPYTNAGTLQIEYYKLNPLLNSDGDTLPLPMRGYTRSYVKYVQSQAAYLDNNDSLGKRLEDEANGLRAQFMAEMSPRQQDGAEYVKIVNPQERVF